MNYTLTSLYTVVTLAFLPLFSVIMFKIRKDYSILYKEVACKLISLFTVLMIFLILRLLIYIDINFSNLIFQDMDNIGLKSEIPFFISEIIITIALSYILFAVGKSTKDSETLNKKKKSPRLSQTYRKSEKINPTFISDSFEESKLTLIRKTSFKKSPDTNLMVLSNTDTVLIDMHFDDEIQQESVQDIEEIGNNGTIDADSHLEANSAN